MKIGSGGMKKYEKEWARQTKVWFQAAVWLHQNRAKLRKEKWVEDSEDSSYDAHEFFDYPEYCGMPKRLVRKMSGDLVDRIQENWNEIRNARNFGSIAAYLLQMG